MNVSFKPLCFPLWLDEYDVAWGEIRGKTARLFSDPTFKHARALFCESGDFQAGCYLRNWTSWEEKISQVVMPVLRQPYVRNVVSFKVVPVVDSQRGSEN